MTNSQIKELVAQRDAARKANDFLTADQIKAQLSEVRSGMYRIALLDEPQGTFWYWTTRN